MYKLCESTVNLLVAGLFLAGSAAAQQPPATAKPSTTATAVHRKSTTAVKPKPLVPVTEKDKQSYAIGLNVGKSLHRDDIVIEPKFLLQGLQDALADGKVQLTDDQIKTVMTALQTEVHQKQEAKRLALTESNKKEGAAFLAENAKKEGVVTLPSGLQYKVLTAGTGPKPTATDQVVCNYRGTLLDKTEFDSSYKRGQPATFPVSGVIKGWTEALQLMPVGSKWELFIPADLAYGERGQGPIAPTATLVFDVELLSIKEKPPVPAAVTPPAPAPTTAAPATPPPATPPPATPKP
jgi:FKBP-type peptidyl-prolyl cis-trans isomerase FklB